MHKRLSHPFILGWLSFAIAESLWLAIYFVMGAGSKWVLEPTKGIIFAGIIIVSTAVWISLAQPLSGKSTIHSLSLMYFGVCLSIAIALFATGPGNLWPIVLVIDYIMAAIFLLFGWAIGYFAQRYK